MKKWTAYISENFFFLLLQTVREFMLLMQYITVIKIPHSTSSDAQCSWCIKWHSATVLQGVTGCCMKYAYLPKCLKEVILFSPVYECGYWKNGDENNKYRIFSSWEVGNLSMHLNNAYLVPNVARLTKMGVHTLPKKERCCKHNERYAV